MAKVYRIGDKPLTISVLAEIIETNKPLALSVNAKKKIKDCRKYLDNKIEKQEQPIYGINTGFGALCNQKISNKELA